MARVYDEMKSKRRHMEKKKKNQKGHLTEALAMPSPLQQKPSIVSSESSLLAFSNILRYMDYLCDHKRFF